MANRDLEEVLLEEGDDPRLFEIVDLIEADMPNEALAQARVLWERRQQLSLRDQEALMVLMGAARYDLRRKGPLAYVSRNPDLRALKNRLLR